MSLWVSSFLTHRGWWLQECPKAAKEGKQSVFQASANVTHTDNPRITVVEGCMKTWAQGGELSWLVAVFLQTIYYNTLLIPSAATTRKSTWTSLLIGSSFQICEEVMKGQDADSPLPRPRAGHCLMARFHLGSIASCHPGDMWGQWLSRDRACIPKGPLHSSPAT